jgi:hypothetical protein
LDNQSRAKKEHEKQAFAFTAGFARNGEFLQETAPLSPGDSHLDKSKITKNPFDMQITY